MPSVDSLRKRVATMRSRLGRPGDPKHWIFQMATDMEIPECIQAQIGARDTVYVHWVNPEVYYGMFSDDAAGSCVIETLQGNFIVDWTSGQRTKVAQNVRNSRHR